MDIEGGGGGAATAADCALDGFTSALGHLVEVVEGGGLDAFDDVGFVGFLQRFEQVRNQTALIDHRVVRDGEARRLPETLTQPSMRAVLVWALRLSPGEAGRRVRAADALGERVAMTGEALAPRRPALAAMQRDGLTGPEQVDICVRALAGVDHRGFDPTDLDLGDQLLAHYANAFAPQELRRLAAQVVDRIDPDGRVPPEQLNADRRHLAFRKLRDGMYACEGRLTGAVGAKLQAVLGPLAAPRVETVTLDDVREVKQDDPRHHGQRTHDALEEVCDRLLRSGTLPDSGGTPTTVIITIDEADLAARRRWGVTTDGTTLSADAVVGLADEADVYPTVISATGVVLQQGRTRRLVTCAQTMALIARDGGCSFPACPRPPEWCQRHHGRRLDRRRTHRPGQPDPALRLPPSPVRRPRLDLPPDRRPPHLDPAPLDGPRPKTPPQHPHHRPTPRTATAAVSEAGTTGGGAAGQRPPATSCPAACRAQREPVKRRTRTPRRRGSWARLLIR